MRLPTEAEWEYACRAGTTTAFHNWPGQTAGTNDDSLVGNIAWFAVNAGDGTRPVGTKEGNSFGLHDMLGNVSEHCSDWFGDYLPGAQSDPIGPAVGQYRVLRGGSFNFSSDGQRCSFRWNNGPGYESAETVGFRVARNP
jgi:formylglycine-generating enzyme required for sulfatase activity